MSQKKRKKPVTLGKKIVFALLAVALFIGLIYGSYYLIHYYFYDEYKNFLSSYTYEQGTELVLQSESLEGYKDYKLVCQSDSLKMYLDESTSNVAIYDKRTGTVTFAAPPDADDDPLANSKNVSYLKSHVIVTYFNTARATGTYDSYSMAVERDQVSYEAIENGFRVIYDMGDYSNSMGIIPLYMTEEKYSEICGFLTEKEAESLGRYYSTTSDVAGMRQLIATAITNRRTQEKIQVMLDAAGFSEEDYLEQMELAGVEASVPLSFIIPLEYRLEDDHVEVSIPVSGIEENGGGSVYKIELLRNFGAADTEETGYIVVPNGDGSVINFNNGKTTAANYNQYVYGIDPLAADYTQVESSNDAAMGLFALCKTDVTILATIEDGASLATISAGVSGRINSYNYAYTTFVVRGSETLEMFGTTGNEAALPVVEPNPYDSMLTVRYSFLDEDHTGYSGVANYYRQRLIDEGVLTVQAAQEDIKFYYDVVAALEMTESFLGKQYMGLTAMTTFEEAGQIAQQLYDAGVTNQVMNLQGWFNDGYYHEVPDYVWVNLRLGGKSGLEELSAQLEGLDSSLYVDVAFQKVTYESDRFVYQTESSKYYASGYAAGFGQVNPVTLRQTSSLGYTETCYDLISPKFLVRYVGRFAGIITDYQVSGISLRDLGSTLQSDKKRTEQINREEALDVVTAQLDILANTGKDLMVNKANSYAWSVSTDIINLPLTDNEYVLVDYDIPLYEMIVHGCIDYCGTVYNLTDVSDGQQLILNMVEYGASPHFLFTWESTSEMKYSGLNSMYSTTFSTWMDQAVEVYGQVNQALSQVTGATIVSHEAVSEDVRVVTYSNGVTIYVNYGGTAVTVNGVEIPAAGYVVQ